MAAQVLPTFPTGAVPPLVVHAAVVANHKQSRRPRPMRKLQRHQCIVLPSSPSPARPNQPTICATWPSPVREQRHRCGSESRKPRPVPSEAGQPRSCQRFQLAGHGSQLRRLWQLLTRHCADITALADPSSNISSSDRGTVVDLGALLAPTAKSFSISLSSVTGPLPGIESRSSRLWNGLPSLVTSASSSPAPTWATSSCCDAVFASSINGPTPRLLGTLYEGLACRHGANCRLMSLSLIHI